MEKLKEYTKDIVNEYKINYFSDGFEEIYIRTAYIEVGKEKFRWVDKEGIEVRAELISNLEKIVKNDRFKVGEATIISRN